MAKAVRGSVPKVRAPVGQPAAERVSYIHEVIAELRKVVWPTRTELARMTGVVVTTVVIFALLIGLADLVFGFVVKHLYTSSTVSVSP